MARVVVTSAAFLGDVVPFVEPANRLVDLGHDVTFLAPAGFREVLDGERFRVATYPLDFSPAGMRADPRNERLMRHPWANQVRLARLWMERGLVADPEAGRRALLDALDGADVLVTHPTFGSASVPVAQHLGVPVVVGQLFPMMIPTRAWGPPLGVANARLGPLNRFAWEGLAVGSGLAMHDRAMDRHRAVLGLPPLRGSALRAWMAADRTVVLVSRAYAGEAPSDWPGPLVGFSPWGGPSGATVDERPGAFLDAGEPPVLVCLGSAAATEAGPTFAAIAAGLQRRGLRPLVLAGDEAELAHVAHLPGASRFAPIHLVAPRCAAAIVSGSLGTLAAALTAGLPVVVVPQLFDQVWHGRRVQRLGVGTMATRAGAASAAARLLGDPAVAERAQALGARLRAEDGAAALVRAVEELVG